MPNVQIKDVPDDVHLVLRRRALEAGQSLQEYLLARLTEEASRPTLEEALRRVGERASGTVLLNDSAAALRAERDSR